MGCCGARIAKNSQEHRPPKTPSSLDCAVSVTLVFETLFSLPSITLGLSCPLGAPEPSLWPRKGSAEIDGYKLTSLLGE